MSGAEEMSNAMTQFALWLKWYPEDFKGAVEAASDFIDTEADLDAFEAELERIKNRG